MFWSIAPLVLACVVLAGVLGMCSFQASGPGKGPAPSYDAPAALQADADALKIPIRLPQLSDEWQSNSGSRNGIDGGRTDPVSRERLRAVSSTVGYLAPSGMYVSLTQSNADEDKLVGSINSDAYPTGVEDVDGVKWVVYDGGDEDGRPAEPVWTARLDGPTGPAQIAITGAARYRRVPYAGCGDADRLAAACHIGDAMTAPQADLTGWTAAPFSAAGFTHDVYRRGEGPGVVLIPEMPGAHPGVFALGNHLVDNGFTVAMPSLFGTPGAPAVQAGCGAGDVAWLCGKGIRRVRDQRRSARCALSARAGPRSQREDAGQRCRRDRPVLHRWLRTRRGGG